VPRKKDPARRVAWGFVADLVEEAARLRGLNPTDLWRVSNKRAPAHARFGIIWVLRQYEIVFADMAFKLGMADYTSALHGMEVATRLREEDPAFRRFTDDLMLFAMAMRQDAEAA
jgi:hypothetical protein